MTATSLTVPVLTGVYQCDNNIVKHVVPIMRTVQSITSVVQDNGGMMLVITYRS